MSGPPTSLDGLARQLKAQSDPIRLALMTLPAQRQHCVCDLTAALQAQFGAIHDPGGFDPTPTDRDERRPS